MNSSRHVVVIGAGIAGLSAAVDLASSGYKVTVLERGPEAGGKMRELVADGKGIDSGPTVFTMRWVFDALFESAGTQMEDEVTLERADRLARHVWPDGSTLDLYSEIDASAASIEAFAGGTEANAYRRFAADSERIYETLKESFMEREKPGVLALSLSLGLAGLPRLYATRPFASLWNDLGRYFTDTRLRQLFARYATYTGSSPFAAPATLKLIAHVERAGVYYVAGGMQRLAEALVRVAARHGAEFRFGSGARQIKCRRGRVAGVLTDSCEMLETDTVVFNGDVAALTEGVLGNDVTAAVRTRAHEARSLSAITWSLNAEVDFPLDHHTVLFGDDYPGEFRALFEEGTICTAPTVYVCAQDRAGAATSTGRERLFFLVNAPTKPHSEHDIATAEARAMAMLDQSGIAVSLNGPNVARFTPNDFAERFPGTGGAIYGWPTHGMLGSFRRQGSRSRVAGLYLAGGSVHPGPGVPMTAISGWLAAASIQKDCG